MIRVPAGLKPGPLPAPYVFASFLRNAILVRMARCDSKVVSKSIIRAPLHN